MTKRTFADYLAFADECFERAGIDMRQPASILIVEDGGSRFGICERSHQLNVSRTGWNVTLNLPVTIPIPENHPTPIARFWERFGFEPYPFPKE